MKQSIGKTYYYPEFITSEEQKIIFDWSLRNEYELIPNPTGPFRARQLFQKISEKLDLLFEIKKRIFEYEDISEGDSNDMAGDFMSIQRNGAKVPKHVDYNPADPNLYSVRYNVFISLPEKGGLPIYDGEVLNIPEKSLLRVDSGIIPHSTTAIEGDTPRIILSYGFIRKK